MRSRKQHAIDDHDDDLQLLKHQCKSLVFWLNLVGLDSKNPWRVVATILGHWLRWGLKKANAIDDHGREIQLLTNRAQGGTIIGLGKANVY